MGNTSITCSNNDYVRMFRNSCSQLGQFSKWTRSLLASVMKVKWDGACFPHRSPATLFVIVPVRATSTTLNETKTMASNFLAHTQTCTGQTKSTSKINEKSLPEFGCCLLERRILFWAFAGTLVLSFSPMLAHYNCAFLIVCCYR